MGARWKHFKTVCKHKAVVYRECKAWVIHGCWMERAMERWVLDILAELRHKEDLTCHTEARITR